MGVILKTMKLFFIMIFIIVGLFILGFSTGVFTIPTVKDAEYSWGVITNETTEIISNVTINNPNPFGISLSSVGVDYSVMMNDVKIGGGSRRGIKLDVGDSVVQIKTFIDNDKIVDWWISHLRNNETTIVDISPYFFADVVFGKPRIRVPYEEIPPVITDILSSVDEELMDLDFGPFNLQTQSLSVSWGDINYNKTEILMDILIYNPYTVNLSLPKIDFEILMNNITMGVGFINNTKLINGDSNNSLSLVLYIVNDNIDTWFVSHLKNDEESLIDILISFEFVYEDFSYFVEDYSMYSYEFTTDILGYTQDI